MYISSIISEKDTDGTTQTPVSKIETASSTHIHMHTLTLILHKQS